MTKHISPYRCLNTQDPQENIATFPLSHEDELREQEKLEEQIDMEKFYIDKGVL